MDDLEFQNWMKQMAGADEGTGGAGANAIWWRAQLRRGLEIEERATRPIRIAEGAAALLCWLLAAVLSAGAGGAGLAAFLALTAVLTGGLRAIDKIQPLNK